MNQTTPIQSYRGAKDNVGTQTLVHIAIEEIISSPVLRDQVEKLRQLDKVQYDLQKKNLPAVTWSGTFAEACAIKDSKDIKAFMSAQLTWQQIGQEKKYWVRSRHSEQLEYYSGLMVLDIDKLSADQFPVIKDKLRNDQYTLLLFTSPGGNGLKIVVKVDGGAEAHARNFLGLQKYYQHEYNIEIDPSGKDCSRLCFKSSDPDAFVHYNSVVFADRSSDTDSARSGPAAATFSKSEERKFQQAGDDLDSIRDFTNNKITYQSGSRNQYIYQFACNCNRKGVDISDCLNYVISFAHDKYSEASKEVSDTIDSAYKHHTHEAGKYAKRQRPDRPVTAKAPKGGHPDSPTTIPATNGEANGHTYQEEKYIQFWSITEDEKRKDEQGLPLKKYNLKYNRLIDFLEAAGYHRLRLVNNSYQYIRFFHNVCEPVGIINMKDYVLTWLRDKAFDGVLEMMRRGAKSYFVPQIMEGLQYKAIEFGKDTQTEAFFYFKNCIVRVTKEGVNILPYTAAKQAIWASSMIQREFKAVDLKLPLTPEGQGDIDTFKNCEMARYILLVSHNPNSQEEVSDKEASQRFLAICSSIGYMLHGFKSRVAKAIIAVDHKIPEDKSEQNGGTGKSIVGESFKYLKSTCIIDGREFKEDYPFRFEMVRVDTKVIVMQDCRWNLDFGSFFVPITNDFTYNVRHTGYITIPFSDSGKWWFDTNFVFKGEGASFRRRMHVIEFDDYFSENHTPYDEFGHFLFQDWDDKQWNLFYNFYLYCVQLYLSEGLIDYPKSNYESRKMVSETPAEFIDFVDFSMRVSDQPGTEQKINISGNRWFEKKELLKQWNMEAKELSMQPATPHSLTKWMKKYIHARPFKLYKDKTNGVEWWLLADGTYNGSGKRSEKAANEGQTGLPF